jgi:arginase
MAASCPLASGADVADPWHAAPMRDTIVVVGVPTALGGHLGGMEQAPSEMRRLGLLERLAERPELRAATIRDAGDLPIEPGFRDDPDPRAKNRDRIAEFLPREASFVADALAGERGAASRLLILGGDCTGHAGALAGLRRHRPEAELAIAWFDAHGDYNTPATTPSGNVWGMPFAMLLGIGDADLVRAASGPTVAQENAALLGGQVLDEDESRRLAASPTAHFGAGMLATNAGVAALAGWAAVVAQRVAGLYIAFDMDALDASGDWAVQMPEPGGLSLETATRAVRTLAMAMPVVGFGATGINLTGRGDARRTVDAVAALTEAAFGGGR